MAHLLKFEVNMKLLKIIAIIAIVIALVLLLSSKDPMSLTCLIFFICILGYSFYHEKSKKCDEYYNKINELEKEINRLRNELSNARYELFNLENKQED